MCNYSTDNWHYIDFTPSSAGVLYLYIGPTANYYLCITMENSPVQSFDNHIGDTLSKLMKLG